MTSPRSLLFRIQPPQEPGHIHDFAIMDSPLSESPTARKNKDLTYLIISGGTGANSIAGAFGHSPSFVLPVSDDGGSSSEILRCFGGPSIGDISEYMSTTEYKSLNMTQDLASLALSPSGAIQSARRIRKGQQSTSLWLTVFLPMPLRRS